MHLGYFQTTLSTSSLSSWFLEFLLLMYKANHSKLFEIQSIQITKAMDEPIYKF